MSLFNYKLLPASYRFLLIGLIICFPYKCFSQSKSITYKWTADDTLPTDKNIKSIEEFDINGQLIIQRFFDNGKQNYYSEKKYDLKQRLIEEYVVSDFLWVDTSVKHYYYDSLGRLEMEVKINYKLEESKTLYTYKGKDTLLISEIRDNGLKIIYTYNRSRNNTKIEYFKNGILNHFVQYKYNKKNQKVQFVTKGYPKWKNINKYDKSGNLIEYLRFDDKGQLTQKEKYYYNYQNKQIRREEFDEEKNEPNFVYVTIYQ